VDAARGAFLDGFQVGCLTAAGVLAVGALFAARFVPSRPAPPPGEDDDATGDHTATDELVPVA
jgi:hypothetical protein